MMRKDREGNKRFRDELLMLIRDTDLIINITSELKTEKLSDLVDCDGTTLLHLAAKFHHTPFVNYLIYNKKYDVNTVNKYNETPLMFAINNHDDIGTFKALINAGADCVKIKHGSGKSALLMFFEKYRRDKDILKFAMGVITNRCSNALEIADALFTAGCQVFHLDIYKKAEITKRMLERGCDPNLQDLEYDENTGLHFAAQMNDLDNVKVLLDYKARVFTSNCNGYPPYVYINSELDKLDPELIKLLMPHGKDWILQDSNLSIIFRKCKQGLLQYLLRHYDIDVNARNSQHQSILHFLMENSDIKVEELLRYVGLHGNDSNINLNARDLDGRTPLHYLISSSNLRIEEVMQNLNMLVNVADNRGRTPLHEAVLNGNKDAVRVLLDAGAKVNVLDNLRESPLSCITYPESTPGIIECAELLLLHGANPQCVDRYGDIIITSSFVFWKIDIIRLLLRYLAILDAHGMKLEPAVRTFINNSLDEGNHYKKCKQELDEIKDQIISGQLTCLQFLTDDDEKIRKYARNAQIIQDVQAFKGTNYFCTLIKKRFQRALELNRLRKKTYVFLNDSIRPLNGYTLIIDNIVNFLTVLDMQSIDRCSDII